MTADPLRRNTNRVVLTDDPYQIFWDGAYLRVTILDGRKLVWEQRVCATDANVEEVARAWWALPIGKAKVEKFIEHADW